MLRFYTQVNKSLSASLMVGGGINGVAQDGAGKSGTVRR